MLVPSRFQADHSGVAIVRTETPVTSTAVKSRTYARTHPPYRIAPPVRFQHGFYSSYLLAFGVVFHQERV